MIMMFSVSSRSTISRARLGLERARNAEPSSRLNIEFTVSPDPLPAISFDAKRDDPNGARPANGRIRYMPMEGITTHASPGTIDHFLVERYILYTSDSAHQLHRARVHHQPYPIQRADVLELDETLIWAAGVRRSQDNPLRHYAREVNVKVYPLERVAEGG